MASGEHSNSGRKRGSKWGQERRLEFIEFRILWDGKINRRELVDFFGISIQQASLDLARYIALAPENLEYDKRRKIYRAGKKLNLVFTKRDSDDFLSQLGGCFSAGEPSSSFVGWRPPLDVVHYPTRSIRPEILMRVIWAIRDNQDIEISYQSMRNPLATRRWIWPHAIAFDGSRWHVRAWCHLNNYFKDFVFARIQQIHGTRISEVSAEKDVHWGAFATVILRAHAGLTEGQRIAIETEYGMRDGKLQVRMREALVPYFVRQMNLDQGRQTSEGLLEWVNRNELEPLVKEARSR
jgi:hypothetical protein